MIRRANGTIDEAGLAAAASPSGTGRLIGRERELDALHRVLTRGMDSPAQLVEVAADPGIGTTRLLDELCGMANKQGRVVLSGRATAFGRDVPFAVVIDALMDALPSLGMNMLRNVAGIDLALLRKGFPGLAGVMADSASAGVERQQLYRAVGALLEVAGWGAGLVLVLDDTHWADPGSVEFIDYLVRHPPSIPFALVVGYRPRQISARLSRALGQLTSMARTRLDLEPLTLAEVTELLGDLGPTQHRRLHEASGGNPLYLEFLRRSDPRVSSGAWWDPECVFDMEMTAALPGAISGEFTALGAVATLVASAAAVAGEQFEPDLVAEVGQLSEGEAMAGLDELGSHDLVRSAGPARRFRYRHPLVRAAAYQLADAGWRLEAHARAARGLARRGAPAATRAHHVARCARMGDGDVIALLVRAAQAAQPSTPDRAAHWLGIAIGLLPHPSAGPQRLVDLMFARARALGASGQLADSRDLLHEVLRLLDREHGERRAEAVINCAAMERLLGRHDVAQAMLTAELSRASGPAGPLTARMHAELALTSVGCGRFEDARAQARLAARFPAGEIAHRGGLAPDAATMFAVHAMADAQTGQAEPARRHLRPAAALLDALPDDQAAGQLRLVLAVSEAELALELHQDALRHAARGIALSNHTGSGRLLIELSFALVSAQIRLGRLADAAGTASDLLDTTSRFGRHELRPIILACQAEIALWRGDAKAGLRLARQATTQAGPAGYWWHGFGQAMSGWAELANGDAAGCVREIAAAGGPGLTAYRVTLRPRLCDLLVQAETIAGNHGAARKWAEHARATAATAGLPGVTAHALLAQARAALAADELAQAIGGARRAAQAFAMLHWRGHEGQARHLLGVALAAAGRREQAQHEWGRAKDLFGACGAQLMWVGVLNEQRRLAARMPRRRGTAETGATSLTGREREIAGLVSAGRTNRQIAERLFLSTKTIETHLTHIFGKLGVTSRSAVAAVFAQLDGHGP
jgi:DNA-binding CsgD family transcriptional regulator/tetratricopeptide (TPR) repeat protein